MRYSIYDDVGVSTSLTQYPFTLLKGFSVSIIHRLRECQLKKTGVMDVKICCN